MIATFKAMLEKGTDNALVRYSLGNAYFAEKDYNQAVPHLQKAVEHDPQYSAAWKLLGRSHFELKQYDDAVRVFERGVEIAKARGDKQAEKEMQVFLRRANKAIGARGSTEQ